MPYENVTLFAVWEPDSFSVTYNSNGGTGQVSRAEVKYGDSVPLPTDIPVYKDGLFLSGWAKSESAKTALKSLKMPAENLTLYAVWSKKPTMAKISLHYDDKVQVVEKEIGSDVDMLDSFGIFKDGYTVEGWYFENSPVRIEKLHITEDCHVFAKWQTAKYITVTIDKSYLNKPAEVYKIPLDMAGKAVLKLPKVDDKGDIYNHVDGCTYGYSDKRQTGEFGTIKYYGETECEFTKDITLYRVLNEYGGNISYCRAEQVNISGSENVGGIVGNACIVNGSLANGMNTSGAIKSAGGIAGTAYGAEIFDNGDKSYKSGGSIIGCGVRMFSTTAENSAVLSERQRLTLARLTSSRATLRMCI